MKWREMHLQITLCHQYMQYIIAQMKEMKKQSSSKCWQLLSRKYKKKKKKKKKISREISDNLIYKKLSNDAIWASLSIALLYLSQLNERK